jgi:hypothetical protein
MRAAASWTHRTPPKVRGARLESISESAVAAARPRPRLSHPCVAVGLARTDGSVDCGDSDMMTRMMKGGDVCCDYTDGRNCGTFPVGGLEDTGEECADTGVVDTTSLSLRMPLNRDCEYWVAALRFPASRGGHRRGLRHIPCPVTECANGTGQPSHLRRGRR